MTLHRAVSQKHSRPILKRRESHYELRPPRLLPSGRRVDRFSIIDIPGLPPQVHINGIALDTTDTNTLWQWIT